MPELKLVLLLFFLATVALGTGLGILALIRGLYLLLSGKVDERRDNLKLIRFEDGIVHLKREDGQRVAVTLGQLSGPDRRWVAEELKKRKGGKENEEDDEDEYWNVDEEIR